MPKKRFHKIIILFTLFVLLFVVGMTLFSFTFEKIKIRVIEQVEEAIQKDVRLDDVRISITQGRLGIRLYNLSIIDKNASPEEIFSTRYLFVDLSILALLKKEFHVQGLFAYRPKLVITVDRTEEKVNILELFSAEFIQKNYAEQIAEAPLSRALAPLLWHDRITFKEAQIFIQDKQLGDSRSFYIRDLDIELKNQLHKDSISLKLAGHLIKPLHIVFFTGGEGPGLA